MAFESWLNVFIWFYPMFLWSLSLAPPHTEPKQVHPTVSNLGLNNTIRVSWAAPEGDVEHYYVYLNSSNQTYSRRLSPLENLTSQFDNLLPGREYSAMVITSSGPFNTTSRVITNATCKCE